MPLPDEDALLIDQLGKVAGRGGGGAGARFTARRLKKDVREVRLETDLAPQAALSRAQQLLSDQGQAVATDTDPADGSAIRGVVGTGIGGLNPAVVTLTVTPAATGDGSVVLVRGAAKEGLIKQRGGTKAAERLVTAWLTADPTAGPVD
ncbi:hypothetical protein GTY65_20400 [Streptomyces sp. SID8379]|uniref:hypothetical protein n=1 Tax=unclassified Streptomyces TaxID=2593676 RepID=UPI0003679143|nr:MULTISPECIES: hypothetical protein [unclassified Streptomyces]MYW66398.1 hypothetical protein [Streptomyces sp. SID8379]